MFKLYIAGVNNKHGSIILGIYPDRQDADKRADDESRYTDGITGFVIPVSRDELTKRLMSLLVS